MRRLLDVLREDLALTGTKEGCGEGECGACSVLIDGVVVDACLVPVCQVDGASVRTVEGLADAATGALDPLQTAFLETGGAQCGICTPGMLMAATALLESGGDHDEDAHPRGHRRQPLPLHRLHQDHRGDRPGARQGATSVLTDGRLRGGRMSLDAIGDLAASGQEAYAAARSVDAYGAPMLARRRRT